MTNSTQSEKVSFAKEKHLLRRKNSSDKNTYFDEIRYMLKLDSLLYDLEKFDF